MTVSKMYLFDLAVKRIGTAINWHRSKQPEETFKDGTVIAPIPFSASLSTGAKSTERFRGINMKANTHAGDEQRTKTSSHTDETIAARQGKQSGLDAEDKANRELEQTGLTVEDVARQSAYEDDRTNVAHQAAYSNRDKKA